MTPPAGSRTIALVRHWTTRQRTGSRMRDFSALLDEQAGNSGAFLEPGELWLLRWGIRLLEGVEPARGLGQALEVHFRMEQATTVSDPRVAYLLSPRWDRPVCTGSKARRCTFQLPERSGWPSSGSNGIACSTRPTSRRFRSANSWHANWRPRTRPATRPLPGSRRWESGSIIGTAYPRVYPIRPPPQHCLKAGMRRSSMRTA